MASGLVFSHWSNSGAALVLLQCSWFDLEDSVSFLPYTQLISIDIRSIFNLSCRVLNCEEGHSERQNLC